MNDTNPEGGPRKSIQRIVLSGVFWNNVSSVVPLAIAIVLTPYLIHGFGLARWGLIALIGSISLFLGPFGGGLGGAMGRYFTLYAGRDDRVKTTEMLVTAIFIMVLLGAVVTVISWWTAPLLMSVFRVQASLRSQGTFMLRTVGILVATGFLHNLFNSVVNARQRYAFTNTLTVVTFSAGAIGLVLCVKTGAGLQGVALVYIGQQAIASIATVPVALRYMTPDGLRFLRMGEVKEIGRYALSVQAMGLIGLVNNQVGSLLVGGLFRLRALAYFNAGSTVSNGLRNLTFNLLGPLGTHMTHTFARGGDEGVAGTFERLQRAWVIVSTGISVVGLGAAYFAVVEWLGPQFRVGGEVAVVALAGDLVNLWTGVLTQYLGAVGRPDVEARYAAFAMVVNLAATIALLVLGPVGVAGGGAVADIAASLYLIKIVRRHYRADTVSFVRDVPVLPGLIGLAVTTTLELVAQPHAPEGALGLLYSGLPALVGAAAYGFAVLGRRSGTFLRVLVHRPLNVPKLVELAFFA